MSTPEERIEKAREVFADATAVIEDVHEAAAAGQAAGLSSTEYLHHAGTVAAAAARLDALASAIAMLLRPGGEDENPFGRA